MDRIAVTGAAGFIGRRVVTDLRQSGQEVVALARSAGEGLTAVGTVTPQTDWRGALEGCEGVIHLLARVHQRGDEDAAQFAINRDVTLRLGRDAAAVGARRLVLVSTIKVNGEATARGQAFGADDLPNPADAYARSKLAAERGLVAVAADTGLQVTIIRPPLVYGPGVRANFLALIRAVERGVPLPFGAIDNRRSLVGLGNLSDLIRLCLSHPNAAGETFLAADAEPISTAALIMAIGMALGRPARLLALPPKLVDLGLRAFGRGAMAERLLGDLVVDASKARQVLGWTQGVSLEDELAATIAEYRSRR